MDSDFKLRSTTKLLRAGPRLLLVLTPLITRIVNIYMYILLNFKIVTQNSTSTFQLKVSFLNLIAR